MKTDMGAALFDRAGAHNGNDAMAGMVGNPSVRSRLRRASHQPDLSTTSRTTCEHLNIDGRRVTW
jgi:hypothetical protein